MSGITNVSGIIALADDSWVEGGFEATVVDVREVQKKAGGSFWSAKLNDGPGTPEVSMSVFSAPKFARGDKIRVSGQGIKKSAYNGKPQVGIGKTTGITVVASGGNAPAAASPQASGGAAAPSGGGTVTAVPGETVGNALTNLTRLYVGLRAIGLTPTQINEEISANAFKVFIFEGGSTFIRGGRALCSGKLAPCAKEQAAAHAPNPQPPQQNNNPAAEQDGDVPF